MKIMLNIFRELLELLIVLLSKLYYLTSKNEMKVIAEEYHEKGRFKIFTLNNPGLKEGKALLKALFTTLNNDPRFVNFSNNKIIIVSAIINGYEYSYHHNVLINNLTTFNIYWDLVKDSIKPYFGEGYGVSVIPIFRVKVWNGDDLRNKHIKITSKTYNPGDKLITGDRIISYVISKSNIANYYYGGYSLLSYNPHIVNAYLTRFGFRTMSTKSSYSSKPSIKPYSEKKLERLSNRSVGNLAACDIETMEIDGDQVPILISCATKS
jgi:hypothetical protein